MHRWMPCWGYFRRRYLQNRSGQMHWMRSMFGCLPYRGHLIGRIITGRKDIGFIRGAVSKWQILAQPLRRVWMACLLFYVCFLCFMRSCLKFFMIIRKITPNDCVCSNYHGQRGRPWPRERVVNGLWECPVDIRKWAAFYKPKGIYCTWQLLLSSS